MPVRALAAAAVLTAGDARAAAPVRVEFHFQPVPEAQMAIWLEDQAGRHVADVLVTQATGKLGIANRPGHWNFLSSWRAPYGPRVSVLPVWAHRRGKTYPRIVFYDDPDQDSLGWHENTSSAENYFCRPLEEWEQEMVAVDTKTCPSPKSFKTDKGAFAATGTTSVYPPRNDLLHRDDLDSEDVGVFAALNDLDAVTAATPSGEAPEFVVMVLSPEVLAHGPLTAFVEINREHDENRHWDFDRETDHFVDPRLARYGIEYLGQPSVVYRVEFDPLRRGFHGSAEYVGYGDWDGATGTLHPPDGTISESDGSGADRLRVVTLNGDTFRWGVFSYGDGHDPDPGDGWGHHCAPRVLAPVTGLAARSVAFDEVELSFEIPAQGDPAFELADVRVYQISGDQPLTPDMLGSAQEIPVALDSLAPPGQRSTVTVRELWGDYTYQFGVVYTDGCAQRSALASLGFTTEPQRFQTVEGFCFLATAAYGAPWTAQVAALRAFRDFFLKESATGVDLIRFYYAHSPPLAAAVAREPLLGGLARVVLQPFADAGAVVTWAKTRGPAGPDR
ncbi:CFI-box-CTERM domain-containing protein [Nannocystis pusilla]|uniref:CFI-box-CTERM domain-containing protein n=1 Tax=Nannocystis pusilla TaxID=889268 RepID=UPI003BF20F89